MFKMVSKRKSMDVLQGYVRDADLPRSCRHWVAVTTSRQSSRLKDSALTGSTWPAKIAASWRLRARVRFVSKTGRDEHDTEETDSDR